MATENLLGALLRQWRARQNMSQLTLALEIDSSQRHLSFVESGRAQPSRHLIHKIVQALDIPLRARNEIFVAAGYAPYYPERPLESPETKIAYSALERILAHHEPYPAMVLDGSWNILLRNSASNRILSSCVSEDQMAACSSDGRPNFMRLMFAEGGMRKHVLSWNKTGFSLLARLRLTQDVLPSCCCANCWRAAHRRCFETWTINLWKQCRLLSFGSVIGSFGYSTLSRLSERLRM